MLKFLLLSSFFIFTVHSQTEINVACPDPTNNKINVNFTEIDQTSWYEVYRSDSNQKLECTHVSFSVPGETIEVQYEGNIEKNKPKKSKITGYIIKNKGSYLVNGTKTYHHMFIEYTKSKHAVIHECESNSEDASKSTSKFSILSTKPILDLLDLDNINKLLVSDEVMKYIKLEDMKTVQHYGEICNSSSAATALTSLIIACAALIKLF